MPPSPDPERSARLSAYWKANVKLVLTLLVIWFTVSFGLGILGVVPLNKFKLGGFPLGFWFAQQGSIYVFLGLVIAYALIMEKIDHKFDVHERDEGDEATLGASTAPEDAAASTAPSEAKRDVVEQDAEIEEEGGDA